MKPARPLATRVAGFVIPALFGGALFGGALFAGGAIAFRGDAMSVGTLAVLGTMSVLLMALAVYWWRQAIANWKRQ